MAFPIRHVLDVVPPSPANTVNLYRQGATAVDTTPIPSLTNVQITVISTGQVLAGDTVQFGTNSAVTLLVVSIDSATLITLKNTTGSSITVPSGVRLLPNNARPFLADDLYVSKGSGPTSDGSGHVTGFVHESILDYILTGPGYTTSLVIDYVPSLLWDTSTWLTVADYANDIQATIDALPAGGGVVYIPAGTYVVASTITTPFGKPVRQMGDGVGRTIIQSNTSSLDMLWIKGSYATLTGLNLKGPAATGTGRGVVVGDASASPARVLSNVVISDCAVENTASWALDIIGNANGNILIEGQIERTRFTAARASGAVHVGTGCVSLAFRGCQFNTYGSSSTGPFNNGYLFWAEWDTTNLTGVTSLTIEDSTFDGASAAQPWIRLQGCISVQFRRIRCVDPVTHNSGSPPSWFIQFEGTCLGVVVDAANLVRNSGDASRGINFTDVVHSAVVSAARFFTASGPSTTAGDEDILINNSSSEVTVIGGYRSIGSPSTNSGAPQLADASGAAAHMYGYRLHVPGQSSYAALSHIQDGDMLLNTAGAPTLRVRLNGKWKMINVPLVSDPSSLPADAVDGDLVAITTSPPTATALKVLLGGVWKQVVTS